ncbi:hypothetical protein CTRI78_v008273 [Colletotrichum trifolii]|uniref:Uncharacterized protein n=1 Tax=Colletotrichum trifolii TaxID=5466 RepID=A0A4R8R581_COLTR|nr:hypothetical protein CTRI78_v008273 [Colletotrichum trifolii]
MTASATAIITATVTTNTTVVEKPWSLVIPDEGCGNKSRTLDVEGKLVYREVRLLKRISNISKEDMSLVDELRGRFESWFIHNTKSTYNVDPVTRTTNQLFYGLRTMEDKLNFGFCLANLYGIDLVHDEHQAITGWVAGYEISSAFKAALAKIPATTGAVIRWTHLSYKALQMLDGRLPGIISKGEPGVYEVRDLVINELSATGEPVREVMATTLGFNEESFGQYADGPRGVPEFIFVINSRSGRSISPLVDGDCKEVVFIQNMTGKFKLVGRQVLGGSWRDGKRGPRRVYYFDEIEAPETESHITARDIKNMKYKGFFEAFAPGPCEFGCC